MRLPFRHLGLMDALFTAGEDASLPTRGRRSLTIFPHYMLLRMRPATRAGVFMGLSLTLAKG